MTTLTYSEAVVRLPQHLSNEFLIELYEYAKSVLPDKEIVERFLVLSPDLLKPGSGSIDDSANMSVDEQLPAQDLIEGEDTVPVQDIQPEPEQEPLQGTSSGSGDVSKNNKGHFLKDRKKSTPYSKT